MPGRRSIVDPASRTGAFLRRALCVGMLVSGCTFPSAEYETQAGTGCTVPSTCNAHDYAKCGDNARGELAKCQAEMNNACTSAYDTSIAQCNEECQACARAAGCDDPVASCKALVDGPP